MLNNYSINLLVYQIGIVSIDGVTYLSKHIMVSSLDNIMYNNFINNDKNYLLKYYSKCLWNTMAPDPIIAQECFVWSHYTNELQYVFGRENVVSLIENREDETLLYPAYDDSGIIALYLYTDTDMYGSSDLVSSIDIAFDFNSVSEYFRDVEIDIPHGVYLVEPTTCSDIYVMKIHQ